MNKFTVQIHQSAEWLENAMKKEGVSLNYSLESLIELDQFIENQLLNDSPKPEGFLGQQLSSKVMAIGAYLGQVIIKHGLGARWHQGKKTNMGQFNAVIAGTNGWTFNPVIQVMRRIEQGPSENLYVYASQVIKTLSIAPSEGYRQQNDLHKSTNGLKSWLHALFGGKALARS